MAEPTLDRRSFLGFAGAGAALAVPGAALAAQPRSHAPDLAHMFGLEREMLAARVGPDVPTASGWDAHKLFNQSAATMLWSAKVQRSSSAERESEALSTAVKQRLGGFMSTLAAVGLEFDSLDDAALAEMERTILEDPEILDEARLKFTVRALNSEVSGEDVGRIDHLFKKTMWRIKRQGLAAIRDDVVEKLDRVAKRDGVDWRLLARDGAQAPFVQPLMVAGVEGVDLDNPEEVTALHDDLLHRSRRQNTIGGVALGVGILWMAGPQIIFGGICFGPPLIIAGIVMLVAAHKKHRQAEELYQRAGRLLPEAE